MASIFCTNCGTELSEDAKFCGNCGTSVDAAPTTPKETDATADPVNEAVSTVILEDKPSDAATAGTPSAAQIKPGGIKGISVNINSLKKFMIPAIAAAVLLVVIIVAAVMLTPSKYTKFKGDVTVLQDNDYVEIYINGKNTASIGGVLDDYQVSMDGTKAFALIDESFGENSNEDGYSLYQLNRTPKLIADNVLDYKIAANGNAVAYYSELESNNGTAELWLYSNGKTEQLTDVFYRSYDAYSISPKGDTLVYVTYDGDNVRTMIWNGKETELGRDIRPIAVADGAKYIYYVRNDSLYVQKGMSGDNREKLGDYINDGYFNKDLSEIIYTSDSKTYLSIKGKPRVSLSGMMSSILIPSGTTYFLVDEDFRFVVSISSFTDSFYDTYEDAIIYVNSKLETDNVARDTSIFRRSLANDGKTVTYTKNGSLYRINGKSANAEATELAEDVRNAIATENGGAVFYTNSDGENYYKKGNGNPVLVSDYYDRRASNLFKGKTLFYSDDEELYSSTGGRGKKVSGINGDVTDIRVYYNRIQVTADDGGDTLTYMSWDGTNFVLVSEG